MADSRARFAHVLFRIGVWIKGLDGILELIGGTLFLFISRSALGRVVAFLTAHELSEDPHDLLANALRHAVEHLSSDTKLFGSVYLLVHGFIKVFLVWGLLRNRLWAYPTAIAFLCAFVGYQAYRVSRHFSIALLVLTVVDIGIVLLIIHEYIHVRREAKLRAEAGGDAAR